MAKELPKGAKKVFTGKIFEVWQWEQEMFDGSKETFEMVKRPDTALAIPIVGEKILIQNQQQPGKGEPFPSIPGGRINPGEDSLTAAKRELLEESGYISDNWELFKEQSPINKIVWTIYTYIARNCTYKQEPELDVGERITTKLITFNEFLDLSEHPRFYEKELVELLVRAKHDPTFKEEFRKRLFGK